MKTRLRGALSWNGFIIPLLLVWGRVCYGKVFLDSIEPGFTVSQMISVDDGGMFLLSMNGTFALELYDPATDGNYYICILHHQSSVVVWTANRGLPMADSDEFQLTNNGAMIRNSVGGILWSAGAKDVQRMQLRDDGNLVMLDAQNQSLWESFAHPTDTLLQGQRLVQGSSLVSNAASTDYSPGDYKVLLTDWNLVLVWINPAPLDNQTYWSMTRDNRVVQEGSDLTAVGSAAVTQYGFSLYSKSNDSSMVWQLPIAPEAVKLAVIRSSGQFEIMSFISKSWDSKLQALDDACGLPETCGPLGVCTSSTGYSQCSCPPELTVVNQTDFSKGCAAQETPNCNANYTDLLTKNSVVFVSLGQGVDYFADQFQNPTQSSISIDNCKQLCLRNCSCAGFSFKNDTGSCFVHETLGTLRNKAGIMDSAFLKVTSKEKRPATVTNSKNLVVPIALGLIGAFLVVAISISIGLLWRRKRGGKFLPWFPESSDVEDEDVLRSIRGLPKRFSYRDLQAATDDFAHRIGWGAYAVVYRGTLSDDTKVAVKKLHSTTNGKGRAEFYSEISTIGSINHVNLVKLRGFCVEGSNRLLVYEFMNRGSLDQSLFQLTAHPVLEWNERYDIALGTAKGLAYLHEQCSEKIIHCDIKPENILLNDKLETKVSDFGLAELMSREESQAMISNWRGTRGYMAPEWLTNAPISHKADVYSYGMVLLEIVAGRRNYYPPDSSCNPDCMVDLNSNLSYFPAYALQLCQEGGSFSELADSRLEGRIPAEDVEKLVKIALCCLYEDPRMRPSMCKVVNMLEGNVRVEDPQLESLLFLRFYEREIDSHMSNPKSAASWFVGTSTTRSPSFDSRTQRSIISAVQLSEAR